MQRLGGDHVAELAGLVGLAGIEGLAVGHANGRFETGRETGEVGRGGDRDAPPPSSLDLAVTVPRITRRREGWPERCRSGSSSLMSRKWPRWLVAIEIS